MEPVIVEDFDDQCALLLKWRDPPAFTADGDIMNQYSVYIKKRDSGPGPIQYGLDDDFVTPRECGLSPKFPLYDNEYQWCIVPMQKMSEAPFLLSNGSEFIAYVAATDVNSRRYTMSEESIPTYIWLDAPYTGQSAF
jgi:hypothetical protein